MATCWQSRDGRPLLTNRPCRTPLPGKEEPTQASENQFGCAPGRHERTREPAPTAPQLSKEWNAGLRPVPALFPSVWCLPHFHNKLRKSSFRKHRQAVSSVSKHTNFRNPWPSYSLSHQDLGSRACQNWSTILALNGEGLDMVSLACHSRNRKGHKLQGPPKLHNETTHVSINRLERRLSS